MTSKTYDYTVVPPPEDYAPAGAIEIILAVAVAVFLGSCICCVLYCKGFFKRQTGTNQRQMPTHRRPQTQNQSQPQAPARIVHRAHGDLMDVEERALADIVPLESSEESLDMDYRTDDIDDLPSLDDSEARTRLHVADNRNGVTRLDIEEVISDRHDTTNSLAPPPLYHELDRICPLVSTESQSPPSYNDFMAKPEIYTQVPR